MKAAEPTIVDGPSSPAGYPKSFKASSTERMISGAEEPNAIRVKFAIVGFQTGTSISKVYPVLSSYTSMSECFEVTTSIASMKMSALIEMPRKR